MLISVSTLYLDGFAVQHCPPPQRCFRGMRRPASGRARSTATLPPATSSSKLSTGLALGDFDNDGASEAARDLKRWGRGMRRSRKACRGRPARRRHAPRSKLLRAWMMLFIDHVAGKVLIVPAMDTPLLKLRGWSVVGNPDI